MSLPSSPAAPVYDAVIVGGGAAGLSTALTLGRARRRVLVLDTGLPRNRFAEHMHTVLGHEGISPSELLRRGREEAAQYGVEFQQQEVFSLREIPAEESNAAPELVLRLSTGAQVRARSVVAASGLTDVLPEIPGLAERWGKTVLHCPYCHGWEFSDQRIGVLALSPMALHHAELLRQWTPDLSFFSAGAGELDMSTVLRLESRDIAIDPTPVVEVRGENPNGAAEIVLEDRRSTEVDAIFTFGQAIPNDTWLNDLSLDRADSPAGSFLAVDQTGRTSHPRIWAAGNIVSPMANVSMSTSAGVVAGGAINMSLVTEDFDTAEAAGPPNTFETHRS